MVKVYAIVLAIGFVGLLVIIMGGSLAENLNRPEKDPSRVLGTGGRVAVAAAVGFGMGGMSAEFSPLDFTWQGALAIAVFAAVVSAIWARFMTPTGE